MKKATDLASISVCSLSWPCGAIDPPTGPDPGYTGSGPIAEAPLLDQFEAVHFIEFLSVNNL